MASPPVKMAGQIRRVLNRSMVLEKRSLVQHEGLRLYPSEIHLLQVIREGGDPSAGEMAKRLGISNGAVSQTLKRLEKKGVIHKTKDPALKNKLTATLTGDGEGALRIFEAEREQAMKAFSNYLSGLSAREGRTIEGFLTRLEQFLAKLD
jgi:DNA-binding MarR family transcriptional regulator